MKTENITIKIFISLIVLGIILIGSSFFMSFDIFPFSNLALATSILVYSFFEKKPLLGIIPIIIAVVLSFLNNGAILSLSCIFPLFPALIIFIAHRYKLNKTIIIIAVSVSFLLCVGIYLSLYVYKEYGSITDGFPNLISDVKSYVKESGITFVDTMNQAFPYLELTYDDIINYLKSMVMLVPGMLVAIIQLFAILCLFYINLIYKILNKRTLFEKILSIDISVATATILLISFLALVIFVDNTVLYYSSISLVLIFLPLCSINGIRCLFGSKSNFRKSKKVSIKIITIVFCVIIFAISPLYFFVYASLWGAFSVIGRTIASKMKNREDK